MARILLLVALVVCTVFAGCAKGEAAPSAEAASSIAEAAFDGGGSIVGNVVDDSIAPIRGAHVAILELTLSVVADDAGRFEFRNLAAGSYNLNAIALGYNSAVKRVEVLADQEILTTLTLSPIPIKEPFYQVLGPIVGYFGCRYAYPGVNTTATPPKLSGGTTGPCPVGPPSEEDLPTNMEFDVYNETVALVGEMSWTQGSFATSQRLRMSFSYTERTSGHWWCTSTSVSPIQWVYTMTDGVGTCHAEQYCGYVNQKVPADDREDNDAELPHTGLTMLAYTNTPFTCADQGNYYELALQQRFEMVVTMFQSMAVPGAFSGFADS